MVRLPRSVLRRSPRRSRWALLSAAAFFFCSQLALALILSWWPIRLDPEYDLRLESLRACMVERSAKPPVLFLGSSRVACTFRPGTLAVNHGDGDKPVVFNFGLCRSGPVMELLCLRRLLEDGVHPECVFVEVWPQLVRVDGELQMALIDPQRLRWSDTRLLTRFTPDAQYGPWRWLERRFTYWRTYRKQLLSPETPSVVRTNNQHALEWEGLDRWGWLLIPGFRQTDDRTGPVWPMDVAQKQIAAANGFAPSADSLLAYNELFALCRWKNITVCLVVMPDAFLRDYKPESLDLIDSFLRRFSQENNLSLVDARAWASSADFVDGVHLNHAGAARFTERFGREVLDPYLTGEPFERRWRPGRLVASAYSDPSSGQPRVQAKESNSQNLNLSNSRPH